MHRVEVETLVGATVVSAYGELDAFAAPELQAAFERAAAADRVVADLSAVTFLDSTALGLVVRASREIDERGGTARIVLPRTAARRIFEITTLDRVLPLASSREDALAEL